MVTSPEKNILFLVPLPPPVHGSAMISETIKDSSMINSTFHCDYIDISLSQRVTEIGHFSFKKVWQYIKALCKTIHCLCGKPYDLCYIALTCHGKGFIKDAPFALLCKLFGRKLVIHQHNKGMAEYVCKWPYNQLLKAVYKDSKVILLSWNLYNDISRIVSKDQVSICHNGIHDIDTKNGEQDGHTHPVRLLYLSNLIPSKGVYELLQACSILFQRKVSFECHIVGLETKEISRKMLLSAIDKYSLQSCVHYEGGKFGKEKFEAFERSDIFVFPTHRDCFPLVLLEAMQHSLPIVTTDEGGIPDIVEEGKNGLICRKNDPVSLSEALENLISHPEMMRSMGKAGRRIYENKFTSNIFEQNIINYLSEFTDL